MNLTQRSITSAGWNISVSITTAAVLFIRSILLARLLPVYIFGIYSFAGSVISLSIVIPNFGMGGAFLHRSPETKDEEYAASVHFSLNTVLVIIWGILLILIAFIFTQDDLQTALIFLSITTIGLELTHTPRLILVRRVDHRRLAIIQLINALLTSIIAVGLAWRGAELWALLATDFVSLTLTIFMIYLWRPIWKPRFGWSSKIVRYYLNFGSRSFMASIFLAAQERIDDIWTGFYLGEVALGYYSRAYTFATYPRRLIASPLNLVVQGTYSELKGDRQRLSAAFFQINAILIRSGFLFGAILFLIAPEFIFLVLTPKWMPMLNAFRLMLVFTLLAPIKMSVATLFVSSGKPEIVAKTGSIQLIVLLISLFILGLNLGINGVALSVDLMMIIGMFILFYKSRSIVDFSLGKLFVSPLIGLMIGIGITYSVFFFLEVINNNWIYASTKVILFLILYMGSLYLLEREYIRSTYIYILSFIKTLGIFTR